MKKDTYKLFRVTIKTCPSPTGTDYKTVYVIAKDASEAYNIYRKYLDKRDICFEHERELSSVELLAEACDYPECRTLLFPLEMKK